MTGKTRVKICGITNKEDALAAIDYGADALGFIRVPQSPRYIADEDHLAAVLAQLPPFVSRVAVCEKAQDVPRRFEGLFQAVQFYHPEGDQTWHWMSGSLKLIYAARVRDESSLKEVSSLLPQMQTVGGDPFLSALLLDTWHKDKLGGSGETFNWDLAIEAKRRFNLPILLAGGLTPENVEEAVRVVQPFAVDVSSGVEAEPGRKDHTKLKAFLQAVRRADAALDR